MPVSIRGRFQRSVHLARDFYGAREISGYVVTAKARELVGRLGDAACTPGSTRAWSLTGPYGGGKSAFALFAAHLFRSERGALSLLEDADAEAAKRFREALPGPFCPILVVGSRRPLREALLTGLSEGLEAFAASLHRKRGRPAKATREVQEALRAIGTAAAAAAADVREDGLVLDLFDRAGACVHAHRGRRPLPRRRRARQAARTRGALPRSGGPLHSCSRSPSGPRVRGTVDRATPPCAHHPAPGLRALRGPSLTGRSGTSGGRCRGGTRTSPSSSR